MVIFGAPLAALLRTGMKKRRGNKIITHKSHIMWLYIYQSGLQANPCAFLKRNRIRCEDANKDPYAFPIAKSGTPAREMTAARYVAHSYSETCKTSISKFSLATG